VLDHRMTDEYCTEKDMEESTHDLIYSSDLAFAWRD
jgi:hypothetical protein